MVRLKAFLKYASMFLCVDFNSTMVRLKGEEEKGAEQRYLYFNSTMVRLKENRAQVL